MCGFWKSFTATAAVRGQRTFLKGLREAFKVQITILNTVKRENKFNAMFVYSFDDGLECKRPSKSLFLTKRVNFTRVLSKMASFVCKSVFQSENCF